MRSGEKVADRASVWDDGPNEVLAGEMRGGDRRERGEGWGDGGRKEGCRDARYGEGRRGEEGEWMGGVGGDGKGGRGGEREVLWADARSMCGGARVEWREEGGGIERKGWRAGPGWRGEGAGNGEKESGG